MFSISVRYCGSNYSACKPPALIVSSLATRMECLQHRMDDIDGVAASPAVSCAGVPPPVPLFKEPVPPSTFCVEEARKSVATALRSQDTTRSRPFCCSAPPVEQQPRPARGASKRKACHPKRSDDGCEATRRRQSPITSSDQEFALRLKKAPQTTATAVRKRCSGAMQKKQGLSADEAIAANQKRASRRKRKFAGSKICSVFVSGTVVPLTPVSSCQEARHARGTVSGYRP